MLTVFCDESGFTGDDLWDPDQPHFVYAAVSVSEDEAKEIVNSLRSKYRIKSGELKATRLLRRGTGKRAMMELVESLVPRSSVVISHKRYSLAGKMFEYLIEPAISDSNSLFYDIGFHKFVATSLYMALLFEPTTTSQTFVEFQEVMRSGDISKLEVMARSINRDGMAGFLGQISTFITCNRSALNEEIRASEAAGGLPRWILELTSTALMSLLASLSGSDMRPLSVTCDESKPLLSQASVFNGFVGRMDCQSITFDGRPSQVTFNLAHEIKFADSTTTAGLQLADLVAGAAAFSMKRPTDDFAHFWRTTCCDTVHGNSILPDLEQCDLRTERAIVNAIVLGELVDRSIQRQDLLVGMGRFIRFAQATAPTILLEHSSDIAG